MSEVSDENHCICRDSWGLPITSTCIRPAYRPSLGDRQIEQGLHVMAFSVLHLDFSFYFSSICYVIVRGAGGAPMHSRHSTLTVYRQFPNIGLLIIRIIRTRRAKE